MNAGFHGVERDMRKNRKADQQSFNSAVLSVLESIGAAKVEPEHYTVQTKRGLLSIRLPVNQEHLYSIYAHFEGVHSAKGILLKHGGNMQTGKCNFRMNNAIVCLHYFKKFISEVTGQLVA